MSKLGGREQAVKIAPSTSARIKRVGIFLITYPSEAGGLMAIKDLPSHYSEFCNTEETLYDNGDFLSTSS
jgi:hypothetical protein